MDVQFSHSTAMSPFRFESRLHYLLRLAQAKTPLQPLPFSPDAEPDKPECLNGGQMKQKALKKF